MSRKRTLPDVYRSRKRVCATPANHSSQEALNTNGVDWNDGESSNHIGIIILGEIVNTKNNNGIRNFSVNVILFDLFVLV